MLIASPQIQIQGARLQNGARTSAIKRDEPLSGMADFR